MRRVWFWIIIGLAALVIVFIIMLPIGIDYGIERYLKDQGADQVNLADVDFNPLTGSMTITGLEVKVGTQTALKIPTATFKIQWTPFIRKRLVLDSFIISDTQITVEKMDDGKLYIGGIGLPDNSDNAGSSAWNFSFQEANINNSKINFINSQPISELKIEQAKILKLTSWMHEDSAHLEFSGHLNNAPLQLQMDISPFGKNIVASGRIKVKGLTLDPFKPLLRTHIESLEGRLDADINIETRHSADDGFSHRQKGQVKLNKLHTRIGDKDLSETGLIWDGSLRVEIPRAEYPLKISANGALSGSQLQLSLVNRKIKLEHQGLAWNGRLSSTATNEHNSFKVEADTTIKKVKIHHPETQQDVLNLERVDIEDIRLESLDNISVAGITLNGLTLLADLKSAQSSSAEHPLLYMQEIKLKEVQLSQQKDLAIDSIHMKNVNTIVQRNPQGKWPAFNQLDAIQKNVFSADQTDRAASDSQTKAKSSEFGFRIGQLNIRGNNVIRFQDESIDPMFGIDLRLLEARLSNLDSRQPQKPAAVKMKLSDGEHARLSLDGNIQPFAERLSLEWVGKIVAFELPPLSPYVIQNTGYRFLSGELQADIPLQINQNKLNGKIDLILYNPTVERVKAEDSKKEEQGKIQIDMPLDSALKLLRDKQNNVKLKIPISGDISDPQFSVADAVNRVLVQTLQTSTLSYLKFMLGPYGIGLAVAEQAIKGSAKIRLNPIVFAPASAELDEAAMDYTQRVAAILKEHPAVQVSVCGVATESDRTAMGGSTPEKAAAQTGDSMTADDPLLILADKRSERIKNQLVTGHGISAKRIIDCKPEIAKGADAQPRVDLEI